MAHIFSIKLHLTLFRQTCNMSSSPPAQSVGVAIGHYVLLQKGGRLCGIASTYSSFCSIGWDVDKFREKLWMRRDCCCWMILEVASSGSKLVLAETRLRTSRGVVRDVISLNIAGPFLGGLGLFGLARGRGTSRSTNTRGDRTEWDDVEFKNTT